MFCGCGGISEGFSLAGFEIVGGIDFNEYATITFKHNFAKATVHNIDIIAFPDNQIDEEYGDVDVIVGGPPCQGFSSANRWQKEMEDPRNKLFFEYIRFVQRIHPKIIMIENVRGLLSRDNGYAIKRIQEILGAAEYNISFQILDASDYGVPQNRKRAIIVGVRKDFKDITFDFNTLVKQERTTVEDAIGELYQFEKFPAGAKELKEPADSKLRKYFRNKDNIVLDQDIVYPAEKYKRGLVLYLKEGTGEMCLLSYGQITDRIDILQHIRGLIHQLNHAQLIQVMLIAIISIRCTIEFLLLGNLLGCSLFLIALSFKDLVVVNTGK